MKDVVAAVVLYHPCLSTVERLVSNLNNQVSRIFLLDNTEVSCKDEVSSLLDSTVSYEWMEGNRGLGAAHNKGIDLARKADSKFILILDQDSVPADDMVSILLREAHIYSESNSSSQLAAIGPCYRDQNGQDRSPFVVLKRGVIRRVNAIESVVTVDHLISSGSLIPVEAIDLVGPMNESLFIDYVDTDWCLRAGNLGFTLLGARDAFMEHSLGDNVADTFGVKLTIRSPLRCYYTVRNGVWLMKQSYVSWHWRVADFLRLFSMFFLFSLFLGQRKENFVAMVKGVYHGILGQLGEASSTVLKKS